MTRHFLLEAIGIRFVSCCYYTVSGPNYQAFLMTLQFSCIRLLTVGTIENKFDLKSLKGIKEIPANVVLIKSVMGANLVTLC